MEITLKDKNYPELLKKIKNPPQELYIKGKLYPKEKYPLAVVGTRKVSNYGRQVTDYFVKALAQAGLTIISGLALGVDGLAHRATLEANGRTIAVLGSGLNKIYPTVHKKLAEKIIESGGAVISEYPPDFPASKITFPARNRIISGLSLAVLVIEAPQKSGALLTARYALAQGRKLFVVPGSIYQPNSVGTNYLIKKGAQAVTEPKDILRALKVRASFIKKQKTDSLTEQEERLLRFLSKEPINIDELVKRSELKTGEIISCLTALEIKGVLKDLGAGRYVRII